MSLVIALCSFYAPNHYPASRAYYYMERLHITAFGVQELILSALYIWTAIDILRTSLRPNLRRIVVELIIINFILGGIDVAGITLEYCNLFFFEVAFKMASYSIKLKLEFAILSKLTALSGGDEETRRRDSRGDSLVFPTDSLSTAVDKSMHAPTDGRITNQRLSFPHEVDTRTTTTGLDQRNTTSESEKSTSEHEEHIETYAEYVRSTSRGG